tara:strand:- start:734 stop:934 length:201 start_codon:yes stop_codon:yes gene_type:complete
MKSSNQLKIQEFDKYIMRGGNQSLKNIEELCDFGFEMCGLGYEPEIFNEIVIDVIRKLIHRLETDK